MSYEHSAAPLNKTEALALVNRNIFPPRGDDPYGLMNHLAKSLMEMSEVPTYNISLRALYMREIEEKSFWEVGRTFNLSGPDAKELLDITTQIRQIRLVMLEWSLHEYDLSGPVLAQLVELLLRQKDEAGHATLTSYGEERLAQELGREGLQALLSSSHPIARKEGLLLSRLLKDVSPPRPSTDTSVKRTR